MSRKLLIVGGVTIIVVAAFALGWFLASSAGFAGPFGPGMMGYGMPMHAGLPFAFGRGGFGFGWGGLLFMGGFALLGWLLQIALIAALVAWLIKPRAAQSQKQPPAQNQ